MNWRRYSLKVFITGAAGVVGASTASCLVADDYLDEVILQDLNTDLAESHALDLSQAYFKKSRTKVLSGGWDMAQDADVVVIAAGLSPNKMTFDPCKDLCTMKPIIESVSEGLNKYCPKAVTLTLTNPLDIFNYILYLNSGLSSKLFIALSANDSMRLEWAIGHYRGINPADVSAYVIGQHAGKTIPLFSNVKINNVSETFNEKEQEEIIDWMHEWWQHFLAVSGNRTAGWTTGVYAAKTVGHITGKISGDICASVILEDGLSVGYPVHLGKEGFIALSDIKMTEKEATEFEQCKELCKEKIKTVSNCFFNS